MSDDDRAERAKRFYTAHFENDFTPNGEGPVEHQQLRALEYMAYQMGQIKQALRRLADSAERRDREA